MEMEVDHDTEVYCGIVTVRVLMAVVVKTVGVRSSMVLDYHLLGQNVACFDTEDMLSKSMVVDNH